MHVPFCAARCDYCDFATWTDRAHLIDAYVDACVDDLRAWYRGERRPPRHRGPRPPDLEGVDGGPGAVAAATSVFFGGGTPSLLAPERLTRVLGAIRRAPGAEVTVECNPDGLTPEHFAAYRAAGVTRISLGMQSSVPHVLAALGRTHVPANVQRAVAAARDGGIAEVNVDLIYGAPGETVDEWRTTLDAAIALEPDHVSAYALTVEAGTPLAQAVRAGRQPAPDDDDQAAKYEIADECLAAAGLHWYEISNWARPGRECRHNLLYWTMGEYLPIGCAAHGHLGGRRFWNVRAPERYIAAVRAGESPEAGAERLARGARAEEAFALALRTAAGARLDAGATAVELAAAGLVEVDAVEVDAVEVDGARVRLTRRGRLLASEVTARLALARAGTR